MASVLEHLSSASLARLEQAAGRAQPGNEDRLQAWHCLQQLQPLHAALTMWGTLAMALTALASLALAFMPAESGAPIFGACAASLCAGGMLSHRVGRIVRLAHAVLAVRLRVEH